MTILDTLLPFGTSIIIGSLIGLEREKNKQNTNGLSSVGIRSNILIALLGTLSAFFGQNIHPIVFYVILGGVIFTLVASYVFLAIKESRIGITTEVSALIVFLLGALCMEGNTQLALILAIITVLILSLREHLHKVAQSINYRELSDTIKFCIIAFVILPFLPNHNYDTEVFHYLFPHATPPANFDQVAILNPYNIWFLVVLVSAVSFLGYILVKTIGKQKGISIAGLIGGLYSSTATSLTLARKSKEYPKIQRPFVTGIVLACGISFLKTYIEIKALNEELFWRTLIPVSLMFGYLMMCGMYLFFTKGKEQTMEETSGFKTPFELKEAIKLGGFIVFALLLAKILLSYTNINFYYIVASAMAFFAIDDPIIISTSASAGKLLSMDEAKNIIILVLFLNMVQKVGVIYFFGNRKLFKPMAIIFGGLFLVSLAALLYF